MSALEIIPKTHPIGDTGEILHGFICKVDGEAFEVSGLSEPIGDTALGALAMCFDLESPGKVSVNPMLVLSMFFLDTPESTVTKISPKTKTTP